MSESEKRQRTVAFGGALRNCGTDKRQSRNKTNKSQHSFVFLLVEILWTTVKHQNQTNKMSELRQRPRHSSAYAPDEFIEPVEQYLLARRVCSCWFFALFLFVHQTTICQRLRARLRIKMAGILALAVLLAALSFFVYPRPVKLCRVLESLCLFNRKRFLFVNSSKNQIVFRTEKFSLDKRNNQKLGRMYCRCAAR